MPELSPLVRTPGSVRGTLPFPETSACSFGTEKILKLLNCTGKFFFHNQLYYMLWLLESSAYPRKEKSILQFLLGEIAGYFCCAG